MPPGSPKMTGVVYAVGRIVLVAPHGAPLDPFAGLDGVSDMLARGAISRFAIANPDHAPFGIAAREALISIGAFGMVCSATSFMARMSVRQRQFALSGNAEGGIIAWSLALAPQVAARGTHALIPQDWHHPLPSAWRC
jgi:molybdate transport system substrate-binding protein